MDKPNNPLDLEEIKGLMAKVSAEPVLDAGDGPFVELWEGDFNAVRAAVATLIEQHERMREALKKISRCGCECDSFHGYGPCVSCQARSALTQQEETNGYRS